MIKGHDFWFWALVFLTLFFWIPTFQIQPSLSTGDHGRDLYVFWMMRLGQWPCRDVWWQYGPLAPLYYGFFFLIGGVNLVSVRIGLGVIYLLSSLLVYRTLLIFTAPFIAFLGSLAFLSFDMSWTFNHILTFPFLFLSIFCLWKYFLSREVRWCYFGLLALVCVGLVKINIALASLAAYLVSLLIDQGFTKVRKENSQRALAARHFIFLPLIFGALIFGAYTLLYWGLSLGWVNQCITASPDFRSWAYSPYTNLKHLILRFLIWDPPRFLALGAFLILGVLALIGIKKKNYPSTEKKIFLLAVTSLLLLGLAHSVEYLLMEGLIYRFDFWIFPVAVMLAGLLMQWASFLFSRKMKLVGGGLLFPLLIWFPFQNLKEAFAYRVPERYLDLPHGNVFLGGPFPAVEVIKKAAHFISDHTDPQQEILVVPYDPLFCFLSGRRQAVRELIFFEQSQISVTQEDEMIRKMEAKQVPLVVISSHYRSRRGGIGHFGKTHCQKLGQYLFDHYQAVQTFGPWGEDAPDSYAIQILQRKKGSEPFDNPDRA